MAQAHKCAPSLPKNHLSCTFLVSLFSMSFNWIYVSYIYGEGNLNIECIWKSHRGFEEVIGAPTGSLACIVEIMMGHTFAELYNAPSEHCCSEGHGQPKFDVVTCVVVPTAQIHLSNIHWSKRSRKIDQDKCFCASLNSIAMVTNYSVEKKIHELFSYIHCLRIHRR